MIVRTVCLFRNRFNDRDLDELARIVSLLEAAGIEVQTKRLCLSSFDGELDDNWLLSKGILLSHGGLTSKEYQNNKAQFLASSNRSIYLDLTNEEITSDHVNVLFEIIKEKPDNTFRFTYGFNLPHSTPYFPSANHGVDGFSVGLQPTNMAESYASIEEWLKRMKEAWMKIEALLGREPGYLGIDSSIAPLGNGAGSLVNFMRKIYGDFNSTALSPAYTKITKFIKSENPRPVGLCGIMFPCLEDDELAEEYENGNFTVERNVFLSLHSGVGIDTYPIAVDQDRDRILSVLQLMQMLSAKYNKPLSARFVSDGKAKIGEKTDFKNCYLKDVLVRAIK